MLIPGSPAPALRVATLDGSAWDITGDAGQRRYELVAFYRGGFCRYCREFIQGLDRAAGEFEARGFGTLAISMDDEAATRAMRDLLQISSLRLGYGLTEAEARRWGLYMSRRKLAEKGDILHAEPAVFLLTPERRIYVVIQQSVSFGRPDVASILSGIDVLKSAGFPLRGNA
jgi:peroxiredoxin